MVPTGRGSRFPRRAQIARARGIDAEQDAAASMAGRGTPADAALSLRRASGGTGLRRDEPRDRGPRLCGSQIRNSAPARARFQARSRRSRRAQVGEARQPRHIGIAGEAAGRP